MKKKKSYHKPEVKRVKLMINNAILATCHSSTILTPYIEGSACTMTTGCLNPPIGG